MKVNNLELEWFTHEDFPEVLSKSNNGFSVDVFVDAYEINEHQIAWFDFNKMKWNFLFNEQHIDRFKWRYFNKLIDKSKQ